MWLRKWPERSSYPQWKHSFDEYYRNHKVTSYYKFPDYWFAGIWFDAQCIYKWHYIAIEYKASDNKLKHTFCSYPDLEAELKRLEYIKQIWGSGYVIIIFNQLKKLCKVYDTKFVRDNWDKQILIETWWFELPKSKTFHTKKPIWDVQKLFDEL